MSELLLETRALGCERDDRQLFAGLDLKVSAGSLVQVAGPNGAGKTTLLRILCGLHGFYQGSIFWRGEPLASVRESFLANLLYLGHNPGVQGALTGRENLTAAVGAQQPVTQAACEQALAAAGLAGYEDIPCRQLSAGQRRRVALARLYLSRAPLWILDEAFTAIDRDGVAAMESLLKARVDAGGAVVFTTHHALTLPGLVRWTLGAPQAEAADESE
ncbi:MAG: cytochrome c biogenesis heme-transporting ATPase CcmA [Halomonadaceae bacterium]|nr:MAG: cytochrome c biogenesis heme-transporting ATPase CcmA [Halomonadaceae bacterium]